jgi:hypothetical protein
MLQATLVSQIISRWTLFHQRKHFPVLRYIAFTNCCKMVSYAYVTRGLFYHYCL